ncbi:MAG: hypothetical protein WB778_00415 [Thermoplasmata archaeon]
MSEDPVLDLEFCRILATVEFAKADLVARAWLLAPLLTLEYHEVLDLLA